MLYRLPPHEHPFCRVQFGQVLVNRQEKGPETPTSMQLMRYHGVLLGLRTQFRVCSWKRIPSLECGGVEHEKRPSLDKIAIYRPPRIMSQDIVPRRPTGGSRTILVVRIARFLEPVLRATPCGCGLLLASKNLRRTQRVTQWYQRVRDASSN